MTTRTSSRLHEFLLLCAFECKQKWQQWSIDLHAFWQYFFMPQNLAWTPIEDMALAAPKGTTFTENPAYLPMTSPQLPSQSIARKKLMVAETINAGGDSELKLVEVEFFPSKNVSRRTNTANHYIAEGEDPNLRITHYPPSNRLH